MRREAAAKAAEEQAAAAAAAAAESAQEAPADEAVSTVAKAKPKAVATAAKPA